MKWLRNRTRLDPDALIKKANESIEATTARQPHVNAITAWNNNRKNQNGFGEDFEWTLVPKGAK